MSMMCNYFGFEILQRLSSIGVHFSLRVQYIYIWVYICIYICHFIYLFILKSLSENQCQIFEYNYGHLKAYP